MAAERGRSACTWWFWLLLMATGPAFAQSTIRINVGGAAYTDSAGHVWSADSGFNTGITTTATVPVTGTADPALYETIRWDSASAPELQYSFPVANGVYRVNLLLAEQWSGAFFPGGRVFSVQMEGVTLLPNVDVFAEVGANAALVKTAIVSVSDGQLDIQFLHVIENPSFNGLEIVPAEVPSSPTGLSASAFSTSQVNLSWTAAVDNTGVAGYQVERCQGANCSSFARIAGPAGTSYADSGRAASTTYRYRVRAVDGDGNVSGYSEVVSATTHSDAPFTPIRVNAGGSAYTDAASQVWSADTGFNTGNVASTGATIAGTSDQALYQTQRWDSGGTPELEYSFAVPSGSYEARLHFAESWDGAFFVGGRVFSVQLEGTTVWSNLDVFAEAGANTALMKTATTSVSDGVLNIGFLHGAHDNPMVNGIEILQTSAPDELAPTTPTGLSAAPMSAAQVELHWNAASDNVAVTGYRIERCASAGCTDFAEIASPSGTTFSDTSVVASKTYRYRVRATDAGGNLSGYSTPTTVTTPASADGQAPTAPTSLSATATSSTQVQLSWTTSTDNIRVATYAIERCAGVGCSSFAPIGTTLSATFIDGGVNGSMIYNYRVRAADATPNYSGYSNVAMITTPSNADVQAPTAPSGLAASAVSGREIMLTWTAATDNVAVARYLIERCQGASCMSFSEIGTSLAVSYSDAALATSTTYRYRVRAVDTANNVSAYSSIAAAATTAASGKAGNVVYEYDSFGRLKRVTVTPE